jgi:hypothetical protein
MKVMSFISTVMAFYVTYFLPIYMTIKVGDYKVDNRDSLLVAFDKTHLITDTN